ncbi:MAG: hypothetical protein JWO94_1742 [Verrucomicrobiaceae bacterium]|nr:hypothetical protein [Verrucomicrobiaceae bacterium]
MNPKAELLLPNVPAVRQKKTNDAGSIVGLE